MTLFAQVLVVITSLAPIGFVYAATRISKCWSDALMWFGVSAGLWVVCLLLLWLAKATAPPVTKKVGELTSLNKEPLAFLVAYALPIITATSAPNLWGLAAFVLLVGIMIWQQRLFYMNPLLGLVGWHFFSCKDSKGRPVLIMARNDTPPEVGSLRVQLLSEYLWLL